MTPLADWLAALSPEEEAELLRGVEAELCLSVIRGGLSEIAARLDRVHDLLLAAEYAAQKRP